MSQVFRQHFIKLVDSPFFVSVSGLQLRCDVIVDEIYKIEIETQTHELFLDDSPEEFLIRASNEEGIVS